MKAADQLADFVGTALSQGRSRDDIARALAVAGWTPAEVSAALLAWSPVDFVPPVPRPRPHLTAAEAFGYGTAFTALLLASWHMTWLGFSLIEDWLPEPWEEGYPNSSSIRWSVAVLVVALPVFLYSNAHRVRAEKADTGRRLSGLGRWFSYVSLFLALLALAGDLVAAIYALLNGDLTPRFMAKAALVALIASLLGLYFRARLAGGDNAPSR